MKFTTLLIDDEPLALQRLERLLKPHDDVIQVIDKASNGAEAVDKINAIKPDLIFLDIQMPELTGFEVLEKLQHIPLIIFSTAYDEYALKAFETNSIDYLLKPVDPERLQKALNKLQRLTSEEVSSAKKQIHDLLLTVHKSGKKRIQVRSGNKIKLLHADDIYFCSALDKYVEVYTFDESFLVNESLNQLESYFDSEDFRRIHRSTLINLTYMKEIIREDATTHMVKMDDKNKTMLQMSRNAKTKFFAEFPK